MKEGIEVGSAREVFSKTLLVGSLFNKRGTRIYLNADKMDLEARMYACGIQRRSMDQGPFQRRGD